METWVTSGSPRAAVKVLAKRYSFLSSGPLLSSLISWKNSVLGLQDRLPSGGCPQLLATGSSHYWAGCFLKADKRLSLTVLLRAFT